MDARAGYTSDNVCSKNYTRVMLTLWGVRVGEKSAGNVLAKH